MLKWVKRHIILLCCIIILVSLCVWDIADPPLWWHFEAQENKRAILEYAEEYFPNAKIVEQVYESGTPFLTSDIHDSIIFEQDGVRFAIWANNGKFLGESFLYAKASQFIEREIIFPFLDSKGLPSDIYNIYMPDERPTPTEDITEYKGEIMINLYPEYEPGKDSPEDIYWLYEFYVYWRSNSNLKNYCVKIEYRINNDTNKTHLIRFKEDTLFENAEEFYAAFRYIENDL